MQFDSVNVKLSVLGCLTILLFSVPAIAQDIPRFPSSIQDDSELDLDQIRELPTTEEVVPFPLESQPDVTLPTPIVQAVEFQIQGNTVFSDEEIQDVLGAYLGKELQNDDLDKIENTVLKLYADDDYLEIGVFISEIELIPDRSSNEAIITVQILERVVSEIELTGAGRLNPYIRRKLRHYIDRPFNSKQFTNEMRFLLDKEAIDSIQTDFLPLELTNEGQLLNEGRLRVDVTLGDIIELSAILNNRQSPSFGEFERGFDFSNRSLTRVGDELNVQYRNTDGSNLAAASYEIPVNAQDGSISVSTFFGRSGVLRESPNESDVDAEILRFSTAFRQPILQKSNQSKIEEVAVGIGLSYIETTDFLEDIPTQLSVGSNVEGKFRSTVLNLFQEYSRKGERIVLLLRSDLDIGLPIGTTNDSFFGDGTFVKGSLEGVLLYRLNNWAGLFSRWNGQISDRTLTSIEQYSVGGPNAVRGADTNLNRDIGVYFSQELRTLLFQDKMHGLELAPYFDLGYATNRSAQVFQNDLVLASMGIALRYQFANRLFATFEFAQPILGRESFRDGSDFKFSLVGRIF